MFKEIKDFTNKGSETGDCIKSKDGKILFETEKILARWIEYVEELFYESRPDNPVQIGLRGPEIIKSVMRHQGQNLLDPHLFKEVFKTYQPRKREGTWIG